MHWLLAGYMWLYIHRPFEVWPWLSTVRIERVYMLITLVCWLMTADKGWIRNRLNGAFGALFVAIVAAWLISAYSAAGTLVVEDYTKVGVFYVLVVSCIRDERRLRFIVVAFLVSTALYMAHSLWEYGNGRHVYRMGTARLVGVDGTLNDPNSFAASLVCAVPLTIPFWRRARSRRETALLLGYTTLTATCVLLTGSRTGFAGLLVVILAFAVISRYRMRVALALVVLTPLVWGILPADRQNRFLTLFDPKYGPTNAQESAETRSVFFNRAVDLWQHSPVFGYGPASFPIVSGTGMQAHTLYGQLLAEVGLVGIVAFASVLACYALNLREIARRHTDIPWADRGFPFWLSSAVLLSVVLLLVLGLGGHNLYRYTWLWYGAFQVTALHVARDDRCYLGGVADGWQFGITSWRALPHAFNSWEST